MAKKKPALNFIIGMKVYPFDVMVSIGQSDVELADSLKPYDCGKMTDRDYHLCKYTSDQCMARAVMFTTNSSLIRIREIPTTPDQFGELAHEIFHVASFVLSRVGVKLKIDVSDEAYAYLIQYLTSSIYKKLNKHY